MSAGSTAIRPARRKRSRWRSPISLNTISTLIVISVLLLMPLQATDIAGWPIDLDIVLPVTALGVFLGLVLARSRFGEITALIVSLLYGIGAIYIAAALKQNMPFREALLAVLTRSYEWTIDLFSDGVNTDPLVLSLLVSILFWFLAYNANWHIFRLDRVWRVILPPGLILLISIVFFSGDDPLDPFLFGYILMALALIVRSHLNTRQWDWSLRGISVPAFVQRQFAAIGMMLSLAALAFAWSVPSSDIDERLQNFQRFLASDPVQQLADVWNRLFAPIEGEGPATTDYYGADLLNLSGAISLGDDIVFTVEAPPEGYRFYWRSRVFERYTEGQWSPSADLRITDRSPPIELPMNAEVTGLRREPVAQRLTVGTANSRIFYAAPQPQLIEHGGRIDLIYTDRPNNGSMNVSVIRPLKVLRRGDSYRVTSLLSAASATELRRAPTDYPDWVSGVNLYVGVPNARVFGLARQIVNQAGATNPYDRAKAIERWLRDNIAYNENISAPPPNVDIVEWVLFDAREGYCTYYATAMILMLRHLGIPARLAAGFSQGQYDAEDGHYVVREREAHTWVEVYFPGYGWIEFEPTSAQAPIHRDGDDLAEELEQPLTPDSTATHTPTPSPTPSPTPLPSPTARSAEEALEQSRAQPTATPTATPQPSPSPTPFVLPTVQPPISPDNPPPLNNLQPLIFFALVVMLFLIILVIIALLLFWWWEWRGMGGLSPVARAYARLERYIQLIGISIGSSQTTLEKRRELQRRLPAAREPIGAISDLYTRERYSSGDTGIGEDKQYAERAEKAWYRTRANILRRWLRRRIPFLRRG